MNSLEFINKEIEGCIKNIEFCEYKGWDAPEYTQRLIDLKEVKEQLEAWEVVKEGIVYQKEIPCEERPEYTYEFKKWVFEINEDEDDFEEKSIKLKKALKVENE